MMDGVYRGPAGHAPMRAAGTLALGLVAILAGCRPPTEPPRGTPTKLVETRRFMAVPWTVTVHAVDEGAGRRALAAAFVEIGRIEAILSDYDAQSELSRLSMAAPTADPVTVGTDLWTVLVRAAEIRDATGGAFDLTVGPLTTLWRRSRRSGRLPDPDRLATARAAVGSGALLLDPATRSVRLTRPGMRIDAGGIGRGYALDRAMDVLAGHGITTAMIDCSGDVVVSGPPPGAAGWRIAVRPFAAATTGDDRDGEKETAPLVLTHAAVTTSGDAYQFVEIDGVRYSHIVDPRSGIGVTGRTAVTVVAPDATTADALATALSVLGPDAGLEALAAFPECAVRFAWFEDSRPCVRTSPNWTGP